MDDSFSSDYEVDNNWLLDLETMLLENCDFSKLRSVCKDRPIPSHLRNEVWKICLNINSQIDILENFDNLFNLPNQDLLHENCCEFVATLPKDIFTNSIGFISDIEIILTYFSRTYKINYEKNNGWLSILRILCCELKLNKRSDLYNYFSAICHRFLPSSSALNGEISSVFRLLLLYHDPELCSFLDTHQIIPDLYARNWFTSLFSDQIPIDALVKLWDMYFLVADPFLMFYLGLIVLLNLKESLLELRGSDHSTLVQKIQSTLRQMTPDDVEDFHSLARHYVRQTPKSFHVKFSPILFGNAHKDAEVQALLDSLCMPVSVHELLESKSRDLPPDTIQYFLVDCRPADQYNAGHLSSAYFFDSSLIMTSPGDDFPTSVQALLLTQQQALEARSDSAGEHVCVLGTGDPNTEHDLMVNMVVAQFLQKSIKYVSMVYGGYRAIHEVLGPQCEHFFISHDLSKCQVCITSSRRQSQNAVTTGQSDQSPEEPEDGSENNLLSRFSSALKTNSSRFRTRLVNYVKNTDLQNNVTAPGTQTVPLQPTATSPRRLYPDNQKTKGGKKQNPKTYRNTGNIFSIDDDGDQEPELCSTGDDGGFGMIDGDQSHPEMINLELWRTKPDVLAIFECCIVDETAALLPGHLLLTQTNLFVLKKSASKLDTWNSLLSRATSVTQGSAAMPCSMVSIHRRRVLSSVVKITSKRKFPECLTFHYLLQDGQTIEQDRYVIKQAGEAARLIKIQVQKMIDAEDAP